MSSIRRGRWNSGRVAHRDGADLEIGMVEVFDRQILVPLEEALDALGVAVVDAGFQGLAFAFGQTVGVAAGLAIDRPAEPVQGLVHVRSSS